MFRDFGKATSAISDLKRYSIALRKLRRPVLKVFHQGSKETKFYERNITKGGIFSIGVLFKYIGNGFGIIKGITQDNTVVFERHVNSTNRYISCPFKVEKPGNMEVHYIRNGGSGSVHIFALGMKKLNDSEFGQTIDINESSVCAAMATFPGRSKILPDAIKSIINQVDYLFIYLNNFNEVPDCIKHNKQCDKIVYILDSASEYRASAKFFWAKKYDCYWCICDDDIIYPKNYVSKMKSKLDSYGHDTVIGVHGGIYKRNVEEYCYAREKVFEFMEPLERDTRVHVLGTGTVFLHASALSKTDWSRLLKYPTENDEVFSLIGKKAGTTFICTARPANWLRSHRKMQYGIFEENLSSRGQQQKLSRILRRGNPWPDLCAEKPSRTMRRQRDRGDCETRNWDSHEC